MASEESKILGEVKQRDRGGAFGRARKVEKGRWTVPGGIANAPTRYVGYKVARNKDKKPVLYLNFVLLQDNIQTTTMELAGNSFSKRFELFGRKGVKDGKKWEITLEEQFKSLCKDIKNFGPIEEHDTTFEALVDENEDHVAGLVEILKTHAEAIKPIIVISTKKGGDPQYDANIYINGHIEEYIEEGKEYVPPASEDGGEEDDEDESDDEESDDEESDDEESEDESAEDESNDEESDDESNDEESEEDESDDEESEEDESDDEEDGFIPEVDDPFFLMVKGKKILITILTVDEDEETVTARNTKKKTNFKKPIPWSKLIPPPEDDDDD